ncbi:Sodium/hydrogen exchanger family-domain-containing protein [Gilbertella persicaria]|uniref:Sodium/hydrogen exchanger family-domain-containing protein n=1 Tax=Gilbertella persicaria TaxID=101096 RepID=UPI0022206180|nr:Sodium/hydrogen exchanger family-domain-containing protein [Gilbertella persicaria]KAI8056529.1 Sodium/hydrogen exchanger family-domain-containing protein [Gilbertella persicaria]
MGRIPGFKETIFPDPSLPFLNLIATLGLVFFLFQVGLEVDMQVIKRDWHKSLGIAVAGMALPFGLGAAVSVGLYQLQNEPSISFGSFLLFLGVAMSITAFPVLARILAELKLLRTKVGAITMAAGLINDCTAWVLLALVVALLNSSGGIEALYVFLTAIGFSMFVIFIIGPLYRKLCLYTHSFENGPSPLLMTVTLLIVLISAFVTNIIGIHAIFGGFLAGVIIPHEHDLAIKITEKIEDMVNIVFLPLYFTLSGLKTQIGLLDTGPVWGYVILVIFLACFGKIVGCTVAARLSGMTTRESFTVGFLMNCKGLVELIVLNIGHDAGVLNDQIFVIMVVMALITTFMTTPMVIYLYPEWYQKQRAENDTNQVDLYDSEKTSVHHTTTTTTTTLGFDPYCFLALLNRIESVPSMMAFMQLLKHDKLPASVDMHALRLLELTERASAVMKFKDLRETQRQDPVLNVLRTFATLIGIQSLQTHVDFCPPSEYIKTLSNYGIRVNADMILLPWTHHQQQDAIDHHDMEFVQAAFRIQHCDMGLFIDRGFGHRQDGDLDMRPQIVVVYRGDRDDEAALLFGLRLQVYRQLDLTVFCEGTGNEVTYASHDTMRSYMQQPSFSRLFTSKTVSNVACRQLAELTGPNIVKTILLNKHDMLILGRSFQSEDHLPSSLDEEKVLGSFVYTMLKHVKTSMLVIQSTQYQE